MIHPILKFVSSLPCFIIAEVVAIGLTCYAIILLLLKKPFEQTFLAQVKTTLIIILLSPICENSSWLLNTLKLSILPQIDVHLIFFLIRLAWIFAIIQYQAFNLFIERLIPSQSKFLLLINRLTLMICLVYVTILSWLICFKTNPLIRPDLELIIFDHISYYYMPIMILIGLIFTFLAFSDRQIPSPLRQLLYTFNLGIIGPAIISNTIQIYLSNSACIYFANNYTVIGILALFTATASYYCLKRIICLDNFNPQNHHFDTF